MYFSLVYFLPPVMGSSLVIGVSLASCFSLVIGVSHVKSVTWKWGLDKRGLGKQYFLQKSLGKQKNSQTYICEKSYKRHPLGAPPKAAPVAFGTYFV